VLQQDVFERRVETKARPTEASEAYVELLIKEFPVNAFNRASILVAYRELAALPNEGEGLCSGFFETAVPMALSSRTPEGVP
jgi:hypothetical protein